MKLDVIPFTRHVIVTKLKEDHGYNIWEININKLLLNSKYDGASSEIIFDALGITEEEFKRLLDTDIEFLVSDEIKNNYYEGF